MEATARGPWVDDSIWASLYEPSLAWADVSEAGLVDTDESVATIHGVTGAPVVVAGLDREPTLVVPSKTLSWGKALRHRLLLAWTSLALLTLASAAVLAAVIWGAPSAAGMAAGFGLAGSLSIVARSVRS